MTEWRLTREYSISPPSTPPHMRTRRPFDPPKVLASNNTFDCRGMVTCDCPNNLTAPPPRNCSNESEVVYQTVYKNVYVCEDEVFVPSGEPPCAFKHLTCNDVEFDSNVGAPNEMGE